jgi:hypothetical protein
MITKNLNDEGDVEETKEEHVELLEAREDSAETLEATEQPLDLERRILSGNSPHCAPGSSSYGVTCLQTGGTNSNFWIRNEEHAKPSDLSV